MNVYIAFFMAFGIGTTALVSRHIGANEKEKASYVLRQILLMNLFIGIIIGFTNLIFSKKILLFLGADAKTLESAIPYFLAVSVPSIFLSMNIILSSALRGAGNTKTPMNIALIANLTNAILNYILIFGILNFNGFGILGAGLATTLSRVISMIFLFQKITNKKSEFYISILESWKLDFISAKAILKLSLPAAVERLIMRSGQVVYGSMIIKIGTEAYAAHNIAGTIESFSYLPGMGFGVAAATLVGQSLGKEEKENAQNIGLISYFLATIFMVIIGIIFYIYAPELAKLFTKDDFIINQVVKVLRIIALFQPFLAITLVVTSALQGAGDTKFPMYSSLIGIWGIRVLGVYILCVKLEYGLPAVWAVYAMDIVVRGIILMVRYLYGDWKNVEIK